MGETLLKSVADEFRNGFTQPELVARTGGYEFGFLLSATNQQEASAQMEHMAEAVRKTGHELRLNLDVTVSTGAAFFPADGSTAETLLATAGRRMQLHKRGQKRRDAPRSKVLSLELAASA